MYSWHEGPHASDIPVFQFPFYHIWGCIWVTWSLADMITSVFLLKIGDNFSKCWILSLIAVTWEVWPLKRTRRYIRPRKRHVTPFTRHHFILFLWNVCRHYLMNRQVKRQPTDLTTQQVNFLQVPSGFLTFRLGLQLHLLCRRHNCTCRGRKKCWLFWKPRSHKRSFLQRHWPGRCLSKFWNLTIKRWHDRCNWSS